MLSSVPFASLLIYSPRGQSEISRRSRRVRDAIKAGRLDVLERGVLRITESLPRFEGFLGSDAVLIPAPRSAPLKDPRALWPAVRICERLVAAGLGKEVLPCLVRTEAVPKSAYAPPGDRPDVNMHYETMAVRESLLAGRKVTVVDDVVTKGATLLAAATRVGQAFPSCEVRTFALLRTMGLIPEVEEIVAPCVGSIRLERGEVHRDP